MIDTPMIRLSISDIRREKQTPTFRAFADEYLRCCEPHWKPSGRKTVRIYLNACILPAFGRMPLDRIGPEDVAAWFDAASENRPGAANRAFEILRSMMFRAEEWGLRERNTNPCLGIKKNPRNSIAQFLDADELALPGPRDPEAYLFPRHAEDRGLWILTTCWRTVCADAKLGRLRLHGMTCGIPLQVRLSCPARTSPWSASCSVIGGIGPRRDTLISPTGTWSQRQTK